VIEKMTDQFLDFLELLVEQHDGFTARELARKFGISYHSVRRYLWHLVNQGYLGKIKVGRYNIYYIKDRSGLIELLRELCEDRKMKRYVKLIREITQKIRRTRGKLGLLELRLLREELEQRLTSGKM